MQMDSVQFVDAPSFEEKPMQAYLAYIEGRKANMPVRFILPNDGMMQIYILW